MFRIDPPKKCRVVDREGKIYHPTQAPKGLCKCGVMLELKSKKTDYIFPSRIRAIHARVHTMDYLKSQGIEPDYENFIIEEA